MKFPKNYKNRTKKGHRGSKRDNSWMYYKSNYSNNDRSLTKQNKKKSLYRVVINQNNTKQVIINQNKTKKIMSQNNVV